MLSSSNWYKKVALMLTTIILIISLTSCEFLKSLFAAPQTQDDWIPESREQTDMIFANYIDYTEKTIKKYFPEVNVQYKTVPEDTDHYEIFFEFVLDEDAKLYLRYKCSYKSPRSGVADGFVQVYVDDVKTDDEVRNKLKPYMEMLTDIAEFSIYLFPEKDQTSQLLQEFKLGEELILESPAENYGEPTADFEINTWNSSDRTGKIRVSIAIWGFLTNENALEYQKSVS